MIQTILLAVVIVILAANVLTAWCRGVSKARIRGILVAVSAAGALIVTATLRTTLVSDAFVKETLMPLLESLNNPTLTEMIGLSDTLNEVILHTVASLVSPLVCLTLFIAFSIVTWVIYCIVTLILHAPLRHATERALFRRTRAMIWGAVQGIAICFILMLPLLVYSQNLPVAVDALAEADVLGESEATVVEITDTYVKPLADSPVLTTYKTLGGQMAADMMTDFEINGKEVALKSEIGHVTDFACNILKLSKTEMAKYGEAEAKVFAAIADSFDQSVLLPTIAGEFIYEATTAWLDDSLFLGIGKPDFGEVGEIFDPFFNKLLEILHGDAKNISALQADFHTVADMISVLAKNGVFANLSNTETLLSSLGGGVVNELITTLGSNSTMKALVPEVTQMGVRAIATTLGIPSDVEAVYGDFLSEVATALNDVKNLPADQRMGELTGKLVTAFDEAGVEIDEEIIDYYSVSMVEDLINQGNGQSLTSADVQAFFALYSMNTEEEEEEKDDSSEGIAFTGSIPLSGNADVFKGTVYEGKTEEQLKNSAAAALAQVNTALSKLDENSDKTVAEQANAIVSEVYGKILDSNSPEMSHLQSVEVTKPVSGDTLKAAAGLQSSQEMKEVSKKVTMETLLGGLEDAGVSINEETLAQEAEAISSIFEAASTLLDQVSSGENLDLNAVASSVGNILDSLSETASFGSEKTDALFAAVLQSKTVREATDMDMKTATQMAEKASQKDENGKSNYGQTMQAVSNSVEVITKFGKDGENVPLEEIEDMIRNINPNLAGMIEVYVTEKRIVGYGVPQQYAGTSAELIANVFHFMAQGDMTQEEYAKEAKALNQVLSLALSAKAHNGDRPLFNGTLPSPTETIDIFLDSHAVGYALRTALLDANGDVKEEKYDAFGLGAKIPQESKEYAECMQILEDYYKTHQDEYTRLTLKAIAALLGLPAALQ